MRIFTADEMSRADAAAQELGIPGIVLMERASAGMMREILRRFEPRRALVVCGGGNNGGDGFVIARELHRHGVGVTVVATKDDYSGDPETNLAVLRSLGVGIHGPERLGELLEALDGADLVVDALLGTGFHGEVREKEAALIREINHSRAKTVAVDVPSGVDGSTGEVEGEAIRADLTVCAHAAKAGCVISPGFQHSGEVAVVDIGIPPEADAEPSIRLTDAASLRGTLPRTGLSAHKYSAGAPLIVAGSRAMTGAAAMAARGAQRAGCGIVFLVVPESAASALDAELTEVLVYGAPEDENGYLGAGALDTILDHAGKATALACGPALGGGEGTRELVEGMLSGTDIPALLDADAVTSLSGSRSIADRDAPTVITPHDGELGRLSGAGAREVSAHRLRYAREAAEEHGCTVLLKGPDTLVVRGEERAVNSTGSTPALATGGTGDVLTGVIGALLSRGMDGYEAARAGAWAHGQAAELWLADTGWPAESLAATDLLPYLPLAFAEIL
ncbi:bifunctional ADP-dependent NAD(P)H-hydrate dehydratase/NAD(P)H-hydrate epimerase [Rubrobacter aplysinae]|uniref:bifunctional ADP-dependent NAD(P)H-hydrate dehydratase/NAD(P)H-hydrate epimerase n=1 Tax=Rubrobacter aplysinae TaxID=909625 RepID=UPI00064BBEC7|nr:bifunctional ADP-dependent NAD(P)H-hydrate dehydratase/NAD(P)H-hydrate epimerase [Rubrobacter aplysinae]